MATSCVFLTSGTPAERRTSLQADLWSLSSRVFLENSDRKDFEVWLLGEKVSPGYPFVPVACHGQSRMDKLSAGSNLLKKNRDRFQYVIRFDDDHLLNPRFFDLISDAQPFDILHDEQHVFYDLLSGQLSIQQRPWIARSAVHHISNALEHIAVQRDPAPLITQNHSQTWHHFYRDKQTKTTEKVNPLSIRILYPDWFNRELAGDTPERRQYNQFLSQFGTWDAEFPEGFENYREQLHEIGEKYFGPLKSFSPEPPNTGQRVSHYIQRLSKIARKK